MSAESSFTGNRSLAEADPEIFDLVEKERTRQWKGLELIASENFTSRAVLETLGSCLTNKYAEGLPGARYYGGNEFIDQIEDICRQRALKAFSLSNEDWGVNVQPYSGSVANLAAYTAILQPHDRIMGLDLPSGGHLSHGYYTAKKKISATSIYFESLPYKVDADGYINYDKMEELATTFLPRLLIAGASAYPRDWDYKRMRQIADKVGAYLLADIAHISGLVATGEANNAFEYCDIVTSTTHKSLRGPRSGVIFFRKRKQVVPKAGSASTEGAVEYVDTGLEEKVNFAVFPTMQGGPHENQIGALAVQLKEVASEEFKQYARQVKANAKALANALTARGYKLSTGGTDNHLILWDLRPQGITGNKMQSLYDLCSITANKNAVPGDANAISPGGVRLGTPALTTRGLKESDFEKVAEFLDRGVKIALAIQEKTGKPLKDFVAACEHNEEIKALAREVEEFAKAFPIPGYPQETMVYKD